MTTETNTDTQSSTETTPPERMRSALTFRKTKYVKSPIG